jgi:hypothetical protein
MLWVPIASLLVVQVAVRVLPPPDRLRAEHPLIETPTSRKSTVPVGDVPTTVAVNVTLVPTVDELLGLEIVVVVTGALITCASGALLDAAFVELPP